MSTTLRGKCRGSVIELAVDLSVIDDREVQVTMVKPRKFAVRDVADRMAAD
jgi:hypothetical protein